MSGRTPTASPTASPTSTTRPSPAVTPASTSRSPARAPRPRESSSAWPSWPRQDARDPSVLAAAPPERRGRVRRRRQRPARAARQARPGGQGGRRQRAGHQRDPVPHRVRHTQDDGRLTLASVDGQQVSDVDEVIVVTGFRPDFGFLSEVRLDLDPALGATRVLADQIHPDHHSCGDVAPARLQGARPARGWPLPGRA